MSQPPLRAPVSDPLREAIKAAVQGGLTLLEIERRTGVPRASVSRFLRAEHTIVLENADKLAVLLGLELSTKETR